MAKVSQLINNFIVNRLGDTTTGFNYWYSQVIADTDYPGIPGFQLTLNANLFLGYIAPDELESAGFYANPLVMVRIGRFDNTGQITPSEVSGSLFAVVDFNYRTDTSIKSPNILVPLGNAVEDAMLETFNRQDYYGLTPMGFNYNNEISRMPGQPVWTANIWRQMDRYVLTYHVPTMGGR